MPGPGEVLLKVGRCGICGTDLHLTETPGATFPIGSAIGHEYAGEVVELGSGIATLKLGDRVTAQPVKGCGHCAECLRGEFYWCANWISMMGGFGEFNLAAESSAVKLPSSLSMADGALVEPLAAGLNGVHQAHTERGSSVLILGAGAIGMASTFWARRLGAGKIVVASRSDRHASMACSLGANAFLSSGNEAFADAVVEAFGGPPDFVFECIGIPGMIELAVNCVKRRGTVVAMGLCVLADPWISANAMNKQVRLQFAAAYTMRDYLHCVDTLSAGAVEPRAMISSTISLDELPEAFEAMRRRSGQCKILVDPQLRSATAN